MMGRTQPGHDPDAGRRAFKSTFLASALRLAMGMSEGQAASLRFKSTFWLRAVRTPGRTHPGQHRTLSVSPCRRGGLAPQTPPLKGVSGLSASPGPSAALSDVDLNQSRGVDDGDRAAVVRVGRMTGKASDRLQGGSAGGGGSFPGGRPPRGRRLAVFHALQQKSDQESAA